MRLALVLALPVMLLGAGGAGGEPPAMKPKPPPPAPAIPPAIAARLPAQGYLIAHLTDHGDDDTFAITRIDGTGAHELVREAALPDAMTWIDGRTLVNIATDGNDVTTVRRYLDGAAAPPLVVAAGAWALPKGKTLADAQAPELHVGKGGAIWLARCHTVRTRGLMEVCTARAWLRVDGARPVAAKKPPAGVKRAAPAVPTVDDGGKLGKGVKAPPGWAVALARVTVDDGDDRETVKGFTCRGPGGASASWPSAVVINWEYEVRPRKVTWLSAAPPLYAITGPATDPVGEVTTQSRLFRGCAVNAVDDAVWLGDGRWLEMKMDWQGDHYRGTTWTLYVDDVAVGAIEGGAGRVQVAPPR